MESIYSNIRKQNKMELILRPPAEEARSFELPQAPDRWLNVHKVATSASLAAGALAFAVTQVSGKAVTGAAVGGIHIGGSLLAHGGRLVAGDVVGIGIQAGARTTAYVVEQAGESMTLVGSLIASTVAATLVGSSVLIGNTLYDIYRQSRLARQLEEGQPVAVVESIEELKDDEFDTHVKKEYIVYLLEDKKPEEE